MVSPFSNFNLSKILSLSNFFTKFDPLKFPAMHFFNVNGGDEDLKILINITIASVL
jgi:hypothetical protein